MNLNILISTIDNRINNVKRVLLKPRPDTSYIICHQFTNEIYRIVPPEIIRDDVFISQISGVGVTKSRNQAIRLATGEIGLFSDDDVTYTDKYIDKVIQTFSENMYMDVAVFKIKTPEGEPEYKSYPLETRHLTSLPFSIGTIEIAFKISKIRENRILFDERFGAGKSLLIGSDENIFILDCIKAGLNVWYYPEYIVQHPYESSVKTLSKYDKRRVSVGGAFDSRMNGWISIPRAFLGTIRKFPDLLRHNKNPLIYLKERLSACFYILFTKSNK